MKTTQVLSGLTMHGYKDVADKIEAGTVLHLERAQDNRYDPNAIKVLFGETHIGWIPMRVNKERNKDQINIANAMDIGTEFNCVVESHDLSKPVHVRLTVTITSRS